VSVSQCAACSGQIGVTVWVTTEKLSVVNVYYIHRVVGNYDDHKCIGRSSIELFVKTVLVGFDVCCSRRTVVNIKFDSCW
jgi:hypothetical protein